MTQSRQLARPSVGFDAAVLALAFLYVWLRVEPELEYVAAVPFFQTTWPFFQQFTDRPGGLLDYATAFLAQFNYRNWLGAAVFTALLALVLWEGRELFRRLTGRRLYRAAWLPLWLLMFARQRFDALGLSLAAGLAVSLGLALGGATLRLHRAMIRVGACWVGAALLFYAAGLWPCVLFVGLSAGLQLRAPPRWRPSLACGAAVLVAPLAWWIALEEFDWRQVLNPWGDGLRSAVAAGLYGSLLLAAAAPLWAQLASATPPATPRRPRGAGRLASGPDRCWLAWLQRPTVQRGVRVAVLAVGLGLLWVGFDGQRQARRAIAYCGARNDHARLLKVANRLEALDPASEVWLHRALFYAGRLLDDLFAFSNQRGWVLFPELRHGPGTCRAQSQTLLELGQVNLAEHFAHEALEVEGERPDLLRLLAVVNVLKGRPQAARVFLHAVRQVPFHGAWARSWLRRLEADPRLEHEPELRRIRARMVNTDFPHNELVGASFCRQLLHANPTNQMAFEYLMAQYLLDRQLDSLIQELPRLEAFPYRALPRHLQEAVVLYQHLRPDASVNLGGHQITPEIRQRFQQFVEVLVQPTPQTSNGQRAVVQQFGHTYWHYYFWPKRAEPRAPAIRATESS